MLERAFLNYYYLRQNLKVFNRASPCHGYLKCHQQHGRQREVIIFL